MTYFESRVHSLIMQIKVKTYPNFKVLWLVQTPTINVYRDKLHYLKLRVHSIYNNQQQRLKIS